MWSGSGKRVELCVAHNSIYHILAPPMPGMSGAELMNVVNEAAFLAARRDADAVDLPELVAAVDRTR